MAALPLQKFLVLFALVGSATAFASIRDVVDIKFNPDGSRELICEYQAGQLKEILTKEQWDRGLVCVSGASRISAQISTEDTNSQSENAKDGLKAFFKVAQARLYRGYAWNRFSKKIEDFSFSIYDYYTNSWVSVTDMNSRLFELESNGVNYNDFLIGALWYQDERYRVLHVDGISGPVKTGSVLVAKSKNDSHYEIVGIVQAKIEEYGRAYILVERLDALIDLGKISIKNADPSFE